MILFDTSVIVDALDAGSPWHEWAMERIAEAVMRDGAAVNSVTISELCVQAKSPGTVAKSLEDLGITLLPVPVAAAVPAGKAYSLYLARLRREGKSKESRVPLPDFLIGAHAESEQLDLVTRDPARVKTYFPGVKLVCPYNP